MYFNLIISQLPINQAGFSCCNIAEDNHFAAFQPLIRYIWPIQRGGTFFLRRITKVRLQPWGTFQTIWSWKLVNHSFFKYSFVHFFPGICISKFLQAKLFKHTVLCLYFHSGTCFLQNQLNFTYRV